MMSSGGVMFSAADGVANVTIDRPARRNALDGSAWAGLRDALGRAASDDAVRVLVVTGAGGAFCAGADLKEAPADVSPLDGMRAIGDIALKLHRLGKPSIAKVDGHAAGAGANLALGCDIVIASDRAVFTQSFIKRGLAVDFGGSWLLPRKVGLTCATDLVLTGRPVGADEALRIGLATRVVPVADLDIAVNALARELVGRSKTALHLSKHLLQDSSHRSFDDALEAEAFAQSIALNDAAAIAARAAFSSKPKHG